MVKWKRQEAMKLWRTDENIRYNAKTLGWSVKHASTYARRWRFDYVRMRPGRKAVAVPPSVVAELCDALRLLAIEQSATARSPGLAR